MFGTGRAKLRKVAVSLPWGIGQAEWEADESERRAAWSLYVELVTRVAVEPLGERQGVLREALASLHSLFGSTRTVLREFGPDVGASPQSVGGIAIEVLNKGLRPFLTTWHPRLQLWEAKKAEGKSAKAHEDDWPEAERLRQGLEELRANLAQYADALGQIAGVVRPDSPPTTKS